MGDTVEVQQPDGTYIMIVRHGDEFLSFTTTADGYSIVKAADGYWYYAEKSGGQLTASTTVARNTTMRTVTDEDYLATTKKYLTPEISVQGKAMRSARQNMKPMKLQTGQYDYNKFRGLVILVEFNDRTFLRSDAHDLFTDMINKENYEGFMSDALIPELVPYTGSVRDYFRDNSNGIFVPEFDVIGPVQINYAQTYPNQSTNAQAIMKAALKAADELVDYSKYDTDGDDVVDMVFFIFAGGGSNVSNNNSLYLWPHASTIYASTTTYDGMKFGRYACSTELYGREQSGVIDGIGTVAHEFSHILGLPDEYDTDYESSGGQSVHPAKWSIMAGGCYLNMSRTPCAYSLYERYSASFATPTIISGEGTFKLSPINTANEGYRINTSIDNEFFLLENRQQTGWDAYLPGHGMLVFRVDSTDATPWTNNDINVNPSHNYYELLRATPNVSDSGTTSDSDGDPFPGTGGVTTITNETSPNICSWTGLPSELIISDITETDGVISFSTKEETPDSDVEDFEEMSLTTEDAADVKGKFCSWTFSNAIVTAPDTGAVSGRLAVGFVKGGTAMTSTIERAVRLITFTVTNPTDKKAVICFHHSKDGATWTSVKDINGDSWVSVAEGASVQLSFRPQTEAGKMYRISEYSGSTTDRCYIDDVTIVYDDDATGITAVNNDAKNKLTISRNGNVLTVTTSDGKVAISVFAADGTAVGSKHSVAGKTSFTLPRHGLYIIKQGDAACKTVY